MDETVRDSGQSTSLLENDIDQRIGARVRAIREHSGESLRAFAARCGVSPSMLSDVERGAKSPTISILSAIAEGLAVPLSRLVSDEDELENGPRVVRRDELAAVTDPTTGVTRSNLGPLARDSTVEFVRLVLPPGTSTGGFTAHTDGTIERIYVAAGAIELFVGGKSVRLSTGDAVIYRAAVEHEVHCAGDEQADLYLVVERP